MEVATLRPGGKPSLRDTKKLTLMIISNLPPSSLLRGMFRRLNYCLHVVLKEHENFTKENESLIICFVGISYRNMRICDETFIQHPYRVFFGCSSSEISLEVATLLFYALEELDALLLKKAQGTPDEEDEL